MGAGAGCTVQRAGQVRYFCWTCYVEASCYRSLHSDFFGTSCGLPPSRSSYLSFALSCREFPSCKQNILGHIYRFAYQIIHVLRGVVVGEVH